VATATKTKSAGEQLEEVRAAARQRKDALPQIERDRQERVGLVEAARQDLRRFYLTESKDSREEARLKATLADAEEALRQPWEERKQAARELAHAAEVGIEAFMSAHFNELTVEHRAQCEALLDRFHDAVREMDAAHGELRGALTQWRPLFQHGPDGAPGMARDLDRSTSYHGERLTQATTKLAGAVEQWTPLVAVDRALNEIGRPA
jgi:hypothetical protein